MDWKECGHKGFVKEIKEDRSLIDSLMKSSQRKIESNKKLILDNTTASTKVSIIYESLREILEALAVKRGFKVYNHECFCAFLDEILKNRSLAEKFNRFRIIRNQINYYGKDINPKEAKEIIEGINNLREELINKYLKKQNDKG